MIVSLDGVRLRIGSLRMVAMEPSLGWDECPSGVGVDVGGLEVEDDDGAGEDSRSAAAAAAAATADAAISASTSLAEAAKDINDADEFLEETGFESSICTFSGAFALLFPGDVSLVVLGSGGTGGVAVPPGVLFLTTSLL